MKTAIKAENHVQGQRRRRDVLFVMEIDYVGIFHIENVPEDQMHPFLLIECPRMIFPFLRRVVSDITRDGGSRR